jgi:hypothetical protein
MRVLIAIEDRHTRTNPKHRDADRAVEGELITPPILECIDTYCAECNASWFGLSTHMPVRTAMVVDRPHLSESQVRQLIHEWLDCLGTIDLVVQAAENGEFEVSGQLVTDPVVAIHDLITDHLEEMRTICAAYPVGTVLSRMGSLVAARVDARTAA